MNEDLDVSTHRQWTLAWPQPSSRDRRYECTSIVASETLRVSCQEKSQAGALCQNVGKITIIHLKDPRRLIKKIVTFPIVASSSSCASRGRRACKNFDERRRSGPGTQAVTAPGAFAFKPRENLNFGAIICLEFVTFWSRGTALRIRLTMKDPSLPSESEITLPKMLATGVVECQNSPWQWTG